MSDFIKDTVIGIIGAAVGVILPTWFSNIGKRKLDISDVEIHLGTGEPDGEGGYFGTGVDFSLIIINKKNKNMFLEKIVCEFYNKGKIMCTTACYNKESYKRVASRTIYDKIVHIEILPKSCKDINVCVRPSGDMTECDKVILIYSWGFKRRKKVIWTRENINANT